MIHLVRNAKATKTRERLVSLDFDSNPVDVLCGIHDSYAAKLSP